MQKIGMVTSCYHPVINGVVRMVELYRHRLTQMGHSVTVFTFGPPSSQDGSHTVRMPGLPLGSSGYYFRHNIPSRVRHQLNQCDVVHCHHLFLGPEKLADNVTSPIVYTNHTRYDLYTEHYLPIPIPKLRKLVAHRMIKRFWPRNTAKATRVIAPSHHIASIMRSFGVKAPIQVIHNGIELNRYNGPDLTKNDQKGITAIYVGRISPEKNSLTLIDGIIRSCRANPSLNFKLVGDGPLLGKCRSSIKAAGYSDRVNFTGWVPAEKIPSILSQADFQITTSLSEVHPLALIEGLAAGLPAVVLNEPAIAEAIGEAAIIAPSLQAWVDGVCRLADSIPLRQNLAAKALNRAKEYSISTTVQQTLALYQQLTQGR